MSNLRTVAHVLWSSLALAAGCGRLGFDDAAREGVGSLTMPPMLTLDTHCGVVTPPPSRIAITNDGTDDVRVTSAQVTGGFSIVTALPMDIGPGDTVMLEVLPPTAVVGTDRPGAQKTGTLTLVSDVPDAPNREIALVATVVGASIELTDLGGGPLALDLVGSGGACPPTMFGHFTNTGTAPATVELSVPSNFALTGFVGGVIDRGSSATFAVDVLTDAACSGADTITYTATGEVCSAPPEVVQATYDITGSSSCACP